MSENWVRPLNILEKRYYEIQCKGGLGICYCLTLASEESICEEIFRQVTGHMWRKCPSLRLVVRERNGEFWFYERSENIEFYFVANGDIETETLRLVDSFYNFTEGPLWSVTVVPSKTEPEDSTGLKKNHRYDILLNLSHVVGDGYTCMNLLSTFFTILDDKLSGKNIDDKVQITKFLREDAFDEEYRRAASLIEKRLKIEDTKDANIKNPPRFKKYFSHHEHLNSTSIARHSFSVSDTKSLIDMCRENKVTVNTAIWSLIDRAMRKMFSDKNDDVDPITMMHFINYRRYLRTEEQDGLGMGIGFSALESEKSADNFWKQCHILHEDITKAFVDGRFFEWMRALYVNPDEDDIEKYKKGIGESECNVTNMGNVDSFFFNETRERVSVVNVDRCSQATAKALIIGFHTILGHLNLVISYKKEQYPHETLEKFISYICDELPAALAK